MRYLIIVFIFFPFICEAQISMGGVPESWKYENVEAKIPSYTTQVLNYKKISIEDERDEREGLPSRFGYKHSVQLDLMNSGLWIDLDNGDRIWQLQVLCPDAKSINFTFDKFWLPEGGKLHIYSKDKSHLIGAFSNLNNKGTREKIRGFACGLVYSDNVVLEYYQPDNEPEAIISVNGIVHGYRHIPKFWGDETETRDFGDSGSCEMNINCPQANNFQDEKRGVALVLVGGSRVCTGSLINNTCNDGELFFLTAKQCLQFSGNDPVENPFADDWSFMWNYEQPSCVNGSEPGNYYISHGAEVVANSADALIGDSNFALMRLNESPLAVNPFEKIVFNGWTRATNLTGNPACIHHPNGDVKKFVEIFSPPSPAASYINVDPLWWADFWEVNMDGSFPDGSSRGAPIFTSNGLIFGQFYETNIEMCHDTTFNNFYGVFGRFDISWDAFSEEYNQLKHWLDPCGTNQTELEGGYYDPCEDLVIVNSPINSDVFYQAGGDIVTNSVLGGSSTVEMKAEESVTLEPDFHALPGSDFWAHIESCMPQVLPIFKKSQTGSVWANKDEISIFNDIKLYPNPASQQVGIEFYLVEDEKVTISITDLSGKRIAIYENQHAGSSTYNAELDISNFPTGLYLVTLTTSNYTQTEKLMVEH